MSRFPVVGALMMSLTPAASGCDMRADAQSRLPVRDERTVARTLRFGGPGERTLDLRAINGSIRVVAEDRTDVQLEARRTVRARSKDDLARADREVTLEVLDDSTRVGAIVREPDGSVCGEPSNGRRTWRRQDYDVEYALSVRVPRQIRLRLCTVNGGDLEVDGTDGDFDISNVNGGITLRNLRGTGNAETVNGALAATFLAVPRSEMRLKTLNGNLDATFPAGLAADLLLKTFNGDLFTDFEVQRLPRLAERREGGFVYKSDGSARVRVGSGGPTITLETFNGDVRLRKDRP
jgi:hypothetical protein